MKYKLIAIDLDGTLLHDGKNISSENQRAIEFARSKGVITVIATGRVTTSGRVFASRLGLETYVISSNGARVYDIKDKKIIYEDSLSFTDGLQIADYFETLGIYYHAYVDDVMYARFEREQLSFYTEQNKGLPLELQMDIRLCNDFRSVFEKNLNKISKVMAITNDMELLKEIGKNILKNKNVIAMTSAWNNIEVMNHTVSKGNALLHLAESIGINREEVISIGDNDNDLSMIKWAGMGIAMGNATEEVKENADHVTDDTKEDGVAKAIYKYIL